MRIRIIKWSAGLVFLVAMYVIGNFVVIQVQEYSKKDDKILLNKYEKELRIQLKEIKSQEQFFDISDKELAVANKEKQKMITSINNFNDYMQNKNIKSDKLTAEEKEAYDWYISQRDRLNKQISDREHAVKEAYKKYQNSVDSYNEKTKRANNLAEKVSSTLIFTPIQPIFEKGESQ